MRSVLIVDDETPSRELIKMSLDWRAFGFDPIFEARNGREALALFGEVVDKLGFHNAQTFYNLFKRCVGMSPSEYKALCEMRRVTKTISQKKGANP